MVYVFMEPLSYIRVEFFEESYQFIAEALGADGPPSHAASDETFSKESDVDDATRNVVLVHCVCGISRSVTILTHYLMRSRRMSFDEAYKFVRSTRDEARPFRYFEALLREVEQGILSAA